MNSLAHRGMTSQNRVQSLNPDSGGLTSDISYQGLSSTTHINNYTYINICTYIFVCNLNDSIGDEEILLVKTALVYELIR